MAVTQAEVVFVDAIKIT